MHLLRFVFLVLTIVVPHLSAQVSAVPNSLLTVGTTAVDGGGAPWAFVTWTATGDALAYGQPLSIAVKNAPAATAGNFAPQGTTQLATEVSIVSAMLSRAAALGASNVQLAADIAVYYDTVQNNHQLLKVGETPPANNLTPAEKIARLVKQATTDAKTAATLSQMARVYPGLALCIGQAWAGRLTAALGQPVTVEVRPCDVATGQVGGVVARTSFNAGQPETMLAPGAPVQVPDFTSTGDRVVKLRWATGDPLRRQFPFLRGFHLYRSPRATAIAQGWNTTPPTLAAIQANPALIQRLDVSPIIPGKLFSATSVADFTSGTGDAITHYTLDDNNRYATNAAGDIIGVPHPDGAAFFYFATASDLLGREGAVSSAGLGTACIRTPPPVPDKVSLTESNITPEAGGPTDQGLRLTWQANLPIGDNDTDAYEIFRGNQIDHPNTDFARPETLPPPVAVLAHAPSADGTMTWRDNNFPSDRRDTITWWYAIRAIHTSPCPPDNASRLTPPLFGSIRNYTAPPSPTGVSMIGCPLTGLYIPFMDHGALAGETMLEPRVGPPALGRRVRMVFTRNDSALQWIEIKWTWVGQTPAPDFTRYEFGDGLNEMTVDFDLPLPYEEPVISARAGSFTGATSRVVTTSIDADGFPGFTAATQLRVLCQAGNFALGEIKVENVIHSRMFGLSDGFNVTDEVALSPTCFSVPVGNLPDHSPVIVAYNAPAGAVVTVDGVEVMENRFVFCHANHIPGLTYRFYRPLTGNTVCLHQADGSDGSIRPIRIRMALTQPIGEYRIYRSVDDGSHSLIAQGDGARLPAGATDVVRDDQSIPANASKVAYFGQTFNRAGIGSSLIPLGERILVGRRDVATPSLRRPLASGTPAAPTVRLEWFCPPDGIERFEVRLAPKSIKDPSANPPSGGPLTLKILSTPSQVAAGFSALGLPIFKLLDRTTLTSPIGGGLGNGPAFSIYQPIPLGKKYTITVRSISLAGIPSPWSASHDFIWEAPRPPAPPPAEPTVAWPARDLPGSSVWSPLLQANFFRYVTDPNLENKIWSPWHAGEYPVGVRIGRMSRLVTNQLSSFLAYYPNVATVLANQRSVMSILTNGLTNRNGMDPVNYLFPRGIAANDPQYSAPVPRTTPASAADSALLPVVLYRQQIANARYPTVSGDVIQVSPLIEKIAHQQFSFPFESGPLESTVIHDPFIGVVTIEPPPAAVSLPTFIDLYLLDTQPVLKGATYRYTLVRLRADNGEIEETIPAGDVTIPTNL
jgi:hypothetical protein